MSRYVFSSNNRNSPHLLLHCFFVVPVTKQMIACNTVSTHIHTLLNTKRSQQFNSTGTYHQADTPPPDTFGGSFKALVRLSTHTCSHHKLLDWEWNSPYGPTAILGTRNWPEPIKTVATPGFPHWDAGCPEFAKPSFSASSNGMEVDFGRQRCQARSCTVRGRKGMYLYMER